VFFRGKIPEPLWGRFGFPFWTLVHRFLFVHHRRLRGAVCGLVLLGHSWVPLDGMNNNQWPDRVSDVMATIKVNIEKPAFVCGLWQVAQAGITRP
jgi:hypothetical protein